MNEPCHTHEWAMSHIWKSHVTHMNEPCHTYEWAMSHIWMSHVTHMNEPCHTYHVARQAACFCRSRWALAPPCACLARWPRRHVCTVASDSIYMYIQICKISMFIYMHFCTYTYTYIYIYICTSMHMPRSMITSAGLYSGFWFHLCIYTNIYRYLCSYTCIYIFAPPCACLARWLCRRVCTVASDSICVYIQVHMNHYVDIHIFMYVYMHLYTYMYVYMHLCTYMYAPTCECLTRWRHRRVCTVVADSIYDSIYIHIWKSHE